MKWNDAELKKPRLKKHYELCLLDLGNKVVSGWWNGYKWDGRKYKGEPVLRWRHTTVDEIMNGVK